MSDRGVERRLSAILAADVAGYTALVEHDSDGTVADWQAARHDTIDPTIAKLNGRTVKLTGDGFLAEFTTVQDAVGCALAMQDKLKDGSLEFRMGVSLGDIIDDGEDIHGEGVNIAARIEALADRGGICLSASVHEQVRHRLCYRYEDMGDVEVKNVSEPVRVIRVITGQEAAARSEGRDWPWKWAAAMLAVVVIASAGWWGMRLSSGPNDAPAVPGEPAKAASIAVLPFVNISGDEEQEYFSDGMTEDLITDLSKVSSLTVVSRTSTSGYKGTTVDIREVGKALDVRYVVEGSVRKAGGRVRINAQLIDATTGGHIWAERYDRELEDIFSVQDEVIGHIVATLSVKLTPDEQARIVRKATANLEAYDLLMRGRQQESFFNKASYVEARDLYQRAIALDPNYAEVHAHLSIVQTMSARLGWREDSQAAHEEALALAERSVALNPSLPLAHFALGRILMRPQFEEYDRAIKEFNKAIALDPSYADGYANLALVYIFTGNATKSVETIETAMRINPLYPFWYNFARGMGRYLKGDFAGALVDFQQANERNPTAFFVRYWLAATLAQVGQIEDAEWEVEEWIAMGHATTLDEMLAENPITHSAYRDKLVDGLTKAGFK